MRIPCALAGAVCVFATLIASPATAADAGGDDRAVYTGALASPGVAGQVAALLALLDPPVELDAAPAHVDTLVAADTPRVIGGEVAEPCAGASRDAAAYRDGLTRLDEVIWEVEDLAPWFERARGSQACLTEPVEPRELARVAFLEGVLAFDAGDEAAARAAFAEVQALHPDYPWDRQFGPTAEAAFAEVGVALAAEAPATVELVVPVGAAAWIDGATLDATAGAASVPPGRHVLQIRPMDAETARTVVVSLPAGSHTTVIDGGALRLPAGADDAQQRRFVAAATALLAALERTASPDRPDVIVALGDGARVWRWQDGALDELAVRRAARAVLTPDSGGSEKRVPGPATAVLLAVGGGLVAGGVVLAAATRGQMTTFDENVRTGVYEFPTPWDENPESYPRYQEWQGMKTRLGFGYGLIAVGGAAMVASIPVGVLTAKPAPRSVAIGATVLPPRPGAATGLTPAVPDGLLLSVTIR